MSDGCSGQPAQYFFSASQRTPRIAALISLKCLSHCRTRFYGVFICSILPNVVTMVEPYLSRKGCNVIRDFLNTFTRHAGACYSVSSSYISHPAYLQGSSDLIHTADVYGAPSWPRTSCLSIVDYYATQELDDGSCKRRASVGDGAYRRWHGWWCLGIQSEW
jgi:hypothetical protein